MNKKLNLTLKLSKKKKLMRLKINIYLKKKTYEIED